MTTAELPRYRDWAPTPGDSKGLALPDRQDWIVCPCMQTRDSEPLGESNFAACERIFGEAGVEYETHRFGHWGPGWFEILLVHPDGAEDVGRIAARLADYPVLDESDLSERECEAESQAWDSWGRDQYAAAIAKDFQLSSNTQDWLASRDELLQLYCDHSPELESFGRAPDIERDELAQLIRKWRKGAS